MNKQSQEAIVAQYKKMLESFDITMTALGMLKKSNTIITSDMERRHNNAHNDEIEFLIAALSDFKTDFEHTVLFQAEHVLDDMNHGIHEHDEWRSDYLGSVL